MQNPIRSAQARGSRRGRALPRSLFVLATVAALAACGENEPDDMSETSMPERPESHVVTGSTEAPQAEADPTHWSAP